MARATVTAAAFALLACAGRPRPPAAPPSMDAEIERDLRADRIVLMKDSAPEMRAAMARAKATFPEFWKAFEAAEDRDSFSVKVRITDASGTEYFWLTELRRADGRVSGTLDNRPDIVRSVEKGQRLDVAEPELVDWMFLRDGKIHGNFTLRPLFPKMAPKTAEFLRSRLAEP